MFESVRADVLPQLADRRRPLRFWSAGCSTGEELYSLAIHLAAAGLLADSFLLGTDCRIEAIEHARSAHYDAAAVTSLPPTIRRKHFESAGNSWRVIEPLRRQVRWKVANLGEMVEEGPWDVVLWREPGDLPESRPGGNAVEPADRGFGARRVPDRGQGRTPAVGRGFGAGVPLYLPKERPDPEETIAWGRRMSVGTKIGVVFALGLVLLAAVGGNAYVSIQHLLEANRWVIHTHEVQEKLEHVLSAHLDAETGQRGFVLTGEDRYLEPYNAGIIRIRQDTDALTGLTRDNPGQQQDLQRLRRLADAKLAELRETIRLRRESGLEAAMPVILTDRGKKIMDDLRAVAAAMRPASRNCWRSGTAAAEASASHARSGRLPCGCPWRCWCWPLPP